MPLKISKKRKANLLSILPFPFFGLPAFLSSQPAQPLPPRRSVCLPPISLFGRPSQPLASCPLPSPSTEADTALFAGPVKRTRYRSLSANPTTAADSLVPCVDASPYLPLKSELTCRHPHPFAAPDSESLASCMCARAPIKGRPDPTAAASQP